jgi:predicted DNA-binding WGR domain protein
MGSPGRVVIEHHRDEGHAVNALSDLVAAKRKRGYW